MQLVKEFNNKYSLYKLSGKIEVIGQKEFATNARGIDGARTGDDCASRYDYIRFCSDEGNVEMVKDIFSFNLVDSYLSLNFHGEFYLLKRKVGKGYIYLLVAVKTKGRLADGAEEFYNTQLFTYKQQKKKRVISLITSTLSILILVGIIFVPVEIILFILMSRDFKLVPTAQEISKEIKSN